MKLLGGAIITLGIAGAFLFRGSFVHQLAAMLFSIYLLPVAILFIVVLGMSSALRKQGLPSNFGRILFVVLTVSGSVVGSLFLGKALNQRELKSARDFVAGVVPELDVYRDSHGEYPATLSELNLGRRQPQILSYSRNQDDPNGFSFYYSDPAGMLDGYGYLSSDREWFYAD